MADSDASDDIEARAATWAVRVDEGTLTAAEARDLDAWLAESPHHLGAYLEAQAVWADLDRIGALDKRPRLAESQAERSRRARRIGWALALAASIGGVFIGSLLAYEHLAGRMTANRGEVRRIVLEDGSTLTLNSTSTAQIRYSPAERRIVLRRGEASFQVAHNIARPFVVEADDMTVTAVGTEFVVDMDHHQDGVEKGFAVTVISGVVKVADNRESNSESPHLLKRDERLVSARTGSWRTSLPENEVDRQIAWRRGLLVFKGQQLGSAAAEVSRYATRAVFIDDPVLARAEFIGTFHLGDAEVFARTAAAAFNAQIIERNDGFHLDRRQNSPSH
jgi:transmembrane sensor